MKIITSNVAVIILACLITAINCIAQVNGNWEQFPFNPAQPIFGRINTIVLSENDTSLYMAGTFTMALDTGIIANNICRYSLSDSTWHQLNDGFNEGVHDVHISSNGKVYAGGFFDSSGTTFIPFIAQWDDTVWTAVGGGTDGPVLSIVSIDSMLYISGFFDTVGSVAASGIAQWNGSAWSALGTGISNGAITSMACDDTLLYVAGVFDSIGGIAANNIAKWDGTTWSTLGSGVNGTVYTLSKHHDGIVVGGRFSQDDLDSTIQNLALWTGSQWDNLDSGTDRSVQVLYYVDSTLFVAGSFNTVGNDSVGGIAYYKNGSWYSIDGGVDNGTVEAITIYDSTLFMCGGFWSVNDSIIANNAIIRSWKQVTGGSAKASHEDLIQSVRIYKESIYSDSYNDTDRIISFDVDSPGNVQIILLNQNKEAIANILDTYLSSDTYIITWNSFTIPPGEYYYKLMTKSGYQHIKFNVEE